MQGTIVQVSISPGGLPKSPVAEGLITPLGLQGDLHAHPNIHGGPQKAILLVASEVLANLRERGYPLRPGARVRISPRKALTSAACGSATGCAPAERCSKSPSLADLFGARPLWRGAQARNLRCARPGARLHIAAMGNERAIRRRGSRRAGAAGRYNCSRGIPGLTHAYSLDAILLGAALPERIATRIKILVGAAPDPDMAARFLDRLRQDSPSAFDRIVEFPRRAALRREPLLLQSLSFRSGAAQPGTAPAGSEFDELLPGAHSR